MNLCTSLMWWRADRARPAPRPAAPDWVTATIDAAPVEAADQARCCGWFDSSHDLHAGMQITEHLSPDPVANEVPLGWWLDWQSRGAALSALPAAGTGLRPAPPACWAGPQAGSARGEPEHCTGSPRSHR